MNQHDHAGKKSLDQKLEWERLQKIEERLVAITESTQDAILMMDPEGRVSYWNLAAEQMLGHTRVEAIGQNLHDLIAPARFLPAYHTAFRKFRQTGQGSAVGKILDLEALRKDGQEISIQLSLSAVQMKDGWHALGIIRDITEHKQAEENIRKQQDLTTKIIETIPLRVFWKDRDLRFLGCNTLFAKDAGLPRPEELIGKTDFEMSWKDQAEIYRADDQQVMDANIPKLSYDEPQTTPEGGQIWVRSSKVPLHNEMNETIGILGVYEDITDYKQAAQALEESERRFRAILNATVDGILVANAQSHEMITGNNAICDMLGYSMEELPGLGLNDIHPAEALPEVHRQFERQLRGEIKVAPDLPVQRKDGSIFFADVSTAPMVLGDLQLLVGVFHDVTERKSAEDQIRRLNEDLETKILERTQQLLTTQEDLVRKEKLALLGQVAGSVGHELRNPLAVMNNAVYFLQTMLADSDEAIREYLKIIKAEIDDADRIVSELLDSVRTKPPQPVDVGLGELIDLTLHKVNMTAAITFTRDIPESLPLVRVDAGQMQQVFRNLISNGVEAMPEGGTLAINAVENSQEGMVSVSVSDTGCGIPPEVLDKLFQPLVTTKTLGIGLGLVVVKNLAEANGGTIMVESAVGQGTTFTVVLPASNSAGKES